MALSSANHSLVSWSPQAAGDRLSSTLFLAGLFHGVVILGITFSGELAPDAAAESTSLEVVIVTSDYESLIAPDEARLLAQKNLQGAGNTMENTPVRTAMGQNLTSPVPGQDQAGLPDPQQQGSSQQKIRSVMTARLSETSTPADKNEGAPDVTQQLQQSSLTELARPIEIIGKTDRKTVLRDSRLRELVTSANTRESRIAAYLNSWKSKVERIGTLNFPMDVRGRGAGNPVLEVAIAANGDLKDVIILQSSGFPFIDQASTDILKIAAPFEPFPKSLREEYDVLRFTYEWRFSEPVVPSTSWTGGQGL